MPKRKMDAKMIFGINAVKHNPRTNTSKQRLMQRKNVFVMTPICGVVMLGLVGVVIVTVTVLPTPVENIRRLLQQNMKCNCSKRGRS